MKQLGLKFSVIVILLAGTIFAANAQTNVLKINILSPIAGTLNLQYEKKISRAGSLQLGVAYTSFTFITAHYTGFSVTPEYRFYLSEEALKGYYLAPFVRYQKFHLKDDHGTSNDLSVFGGGLIVGKQIVSRNKITIDFFVGPIYNESSVVGGTDTSRFRGIGARAGLCVGYAF